MTIKGMLTQDKKSNELTIQFSCKPRSKAESTRIFDAIKSALEKIAAQENGRISIQTTVRKPRVKGA